MAEIVHKEKLVKPCPRCGCEYCLIKVYHFGTTFKPICEQCGLNDNKSGDNIATAKAVMVNCFYEFGSKVNQ
jgi:hypothetical protein